MRTEKLSVNKMCMVVCAALFLLSVVMSCTIYFLTRDILALAPVFLHAKNCHLVVNSFHLE